jgi:hypothetical protein
MSNKYRNPFKVRLSEKIESDASFLRIYSPSVLEILEQKYNEGLLWNNVIFIRSSPGAGKTSLLRLFEPGVTTTLHKNQSSQQYKEIYQRLSKLDVFSKKRPDLLGVPISCAKNYELLEDLEISEGQKKRLFFSLLNARITIATLKSLLLLKDASFPDGLNRISFEYDNRDGYFKHSPYPSNGKELFEWASRIEARVYEIIDSFTPVNEPSIEGHDELFSLSVLQPDNIKFDGSNTFGKILFMLDDTHKLTSTQRAFLTRHLSEKRGAFSVWIAERLEVLTTDDQFTTSVINRDFQIINLEEFWGRYSGKFDKILEGVASKRASFSSEDVNSFKEYLSDNLDEEKYSKNIEESIEETQIYFSKILSATEKYSEWVRFVTLQEASPYEKAIQFQRLRILIERSLNKKQLTIEFVLGTDELVEKLNASDITAAAALFLYKKYQLPYYFSFPTLCKLSNSNIDQFLTLSGDLFEVMLSKKLSGVNVMLSSEEQHKLLKKSVEERWRGLSKYVPYSSQVVSFLKNLSEFCVKETYKDNSPYAPGVTGFAIKDNPRGRLIPEESWDKNEVYVPLKNVISTCIAFNLLEKRTQNQGEKGQTWDVFFLNRWICARYDLPLTYNGFRHKTPNELIKWTKP